VATRQPRIKPQGICSVGDYAGASLQDDQGCELRQQIVEKWNGNNCQHVIDNVIRRWRRRQRGCVDADSGHFEHSLWLTFWLPQWTSLSFLKLSVWLYCIDCIVICSALYSQALIWLFIAKNIYHIFAQSNVSIVRTFAANFYVNWPIIIQIIAKNKKGCFFYETPCSVNQSRRARLVSVLQTSKKYMQSVLTSLCFQFKHISFKQLIYILDSMFLFTHQQ